MKVIKNQQLTEHFNLLEFFPNEKYRNKINQLGGVDDTIFDRIQMVAEKLEKIRAKFGKYAIIITSGYRTSEQNYNCGGCKSSRHTYGLAVDFYVRGLLSPSVFRILKSDKPLLRDLGVYELLYYPDRAFIHISFLLPNEKKPLKILTL